MNAIAGKLFGTIGHSGQIAASVATRIAGSPANQQQFGQSMVERKRRAASV